MPKHTPTGTTPARPQQERSSDRGNRPVSEITEGELLAILARARQTVKPIVKREASAEVVSEDILNFKMKSA